MGKFTVLCLLISTAIVLVTFGKGMGVLHGGDVASHLHWAMASLLAVLMANVMGMVHALQSDRVIRELRDYLAALLPTDPPEPQ